MISKGSLHSLSWLGISVSRTFCVLLREYRVVRGRSPLHAGQISRNHAPHFAKIGRIGRILGDCFFCGCSHTRYLARPCRAGLRVVALASRWRVGGVGNDYYHQLKPARSMYRYHHVHTWSGENEVSVGFSKRTGIQKTLGWSPRAVLLKKNSKVLIFRLLY